MSKEVNAPKWLGKFPVLAMHKPEVAESFMEDSCHLSTSLDIKVCGGMIRVIASGHSKHGANGIDFESSNGGVTLVNFYPREGGVMTTGAGSAYIPCPSLGEAFELAGHIVANITMSQEASL